MPAIQLSFDEATHTADAIQRAAYKFCAHFALELQRNDGRFLCTLHFLDGQEQDPGVVDSFRIEVLDQILRERIRNETQTVRNVILAVAFSKTKLSDE